MNKEQTKKTFKLKKKETNQINSFLIELSKKNPLINLVGKSTIINFWDRHACDSLQLINFIKNKNKTILDMGSGAGLPGTILSIMGYKNITMVDSRKKKTKFIKETLLKLNLRANIITSRIEELKLPPFDYITCRALAPLNKLINYSLFFSNHETTLVFLKGKNVNKEIYEAKKSFLFDHKLFKSKSSGEGFVLRVKNFSYKK